MKLEDTVAVVTGAGSGIGRALVLELVRRGARVAAWDRNEKTLAETKSLALPSRVEIFPVDVSKRAQVDAALRGTLETFKNIDVVINNAGVMQPFKRLIELDDAAIDRVFGVNWQGTLNVTRATLPLLLGRPRAHLVNVSSLGGFVPVPGQTIYGASKAAVMLLTEGLNAELAGTNVGVTVVLPGVVATNILANSGLDAKAMAGVGDTSKMTQPGDAAREILDGVEHDAFRVLVGRDARALDVAVRLNPKRATKFIARQMAGLLAAAK